MLPEDKRQQLDGIVKKMVQNKESDSNIRFVVDDFKKKYTPVNVVEPTPYQVADKKSATEYGASFPAETHKDSPLDAGLKAAGNTPSSVIHLGKNLFNTFRHPINTLTGIGNATLGGVQKGIVKATGYDMGDEDARSTYNALSDALKDRYGSLDNLQRTATNDPAGFGADVLSILEGGAGVLGKTVALDSALTKIADVATLPISKAGSAVSRGVGEGLGLSTGAQYGALKEGMTSALTGGEKGQAFSDALRGKVSPDQIVNEAKDALGTILENRKADYATRLEGLKTNTAEFSHAPVVDAFQKLLNKFGVIVDEEGKLDFSRAPGLSRNQNDVLQLQKTLEDWGTQAGDNTIVGIDKFKQVIDDFRIGSQDSRKFDSFVSTLRNEAQGLIKDQPGYKEMVGNYEQSSGLIKEIQKGLSLSDKNMVDTAFRKLTSALRTNNEFRKQLVNELDEVSGGLLSSKIAGQQLSELLPRGTARVVESILGTGTILSTGPAGIIPLLKIALFTSPRIVGEVINALGIGSKYAKPLIEMLNKASQGYPVIPFTRGEKSTKE